MKNIVTTGIVLCITVLFVFLYSNLFRDTEVVPRSIQDDIPQYMDTARSMSTVPNDLIKIYTATHASYKMYQEYYENNRDRSVFEKKRF